LYLSIAIVDVDERALHSFKLQFAHMAIAILRLPKKNESHIIPIQQINTVNHILNIKTIHLLALD
jgi:hypothetical protein